MNPLALGQFKGPALKNISAANSRRRKKAYIEELEEERAIVDAKFAE